MATHVHSPITPEVLDRIHRALEDEDSPAPWIQRAFEALAIAQGNAARVELLETALTRLDAIARHDHLTPSGEGELIAALEQSFRLLHPDEKPALQRCRVCGCTNEEACLALDAVNDRLGCSWVEPDLCSTCVPGGSPWAPK